MFEETDSVFTKGNIIVLSLYLVFKCVTVHELPLSLVIHLINTDVCTTDIQ